MGEHDRRFKSLVREFLAELLALFAPASAALLDASRPHWLEQELQPDPPTGDVIVVDLVARVGLRDRPGESALAHVEVESRDAVATVPERVYAYRTELRRKHKVPVLSLAVYLRVARQGTGTEEYAEEFTAEQSLRFRFPYAGLPGLDAEAYVAGDNWLGVALSGLMKVRPDRQAWLRAEALRRILVESGLNDYRRYLLAECVEAYSPLEGEQAGAFLRMLEEERYREVKAMQMTSYEKGEAAGLAKGEAAGLAKGEAAGLAKGEILGQRDLTRRVLEGRFGPLPEASARRLDATPPDRLADLLLAALSAASLAELGLAD